MLEGSVTNREKEVIQLVAKSYATKEIARVLTISTKTVNDTRQRIYRKLGLGDIAALTRYAIRHGLVSAEE